MDRLKDFIRWYYDRFCSFYQVVLDSISDFNALCNSIAKYVDSDDKMRKEVNDLIRSFTRLGDLVINKPVPNLYHYYNPDEKYVTLAIAYADVGAKVSIEYDEFTIGYVFRFKSKSGYYITSNLAYKYILPIIGRGATEEVKINASSITGIILMLTLLDYVKPFESLEALRSYISNMKINKLLDCIKDVKFKTMDVFDETARSLFGDVLDVDISEKSAITNRYYIRSDIVNEFRESWGFRCPSGGINIRGSFGVIDGVCGILRVLIGRKGERMLIDVSDVFSYTGKITPYDLVKMLNYIVSIYMYYIAIMDKLYGCLSKEVIFI